MTKTPSVEIVEPRIIPSPEGLYSYTAWIDDWLFVHHNKEGGNAFTVRIWRFRSDGSQFEMLDLPAHSSCASDWIKAVLLPSVLPDGRLGYISRCRPPDDILTTLQFTMAYDIESEEAVPLLNYSVAEFGLGTGGMVWNPELTRGLMGDGDVYIDEKLQWFTAEGSEVIDVGLAQAYGASWSPDGEKIAFVGSKEQGSPLAHSVYDLYLMSAEGSEVRPIVRGFHASGGVEWSPNGRWLVFPANFGEEEGDNQGLWLIDPEAGDLRTIAEGVFGVPAWSPDGQRLVVVQFLGPPGEREHRLVSLDVGSILEE